jgi:putative transposase
VLSRTRLNSDRGCQYTSAQLARFAGEHNLTQSVGRTGVCWDNAAADWIERVYNRRRRHSALGMLGPVEYENRSTQTAKAA